MDVKLTFENVHAVSAGTATLGTLKLTNFHIIFSAPVPTKEAPTSASAPATTPALTPSSTSSSALALTAAPAPAKAASETDGGSAAATQQKHKPAHVRHRESWITYPIIAHCTYRPTPPSSPVSSCIRLRCRDFNFVCFNFADDRQAREAFEFIRTRTCRLGSIEKLYAFSYSPPRQEREVRGWHLYDTRTEFRRQGISEKLADKGWRISTINKDYSFSPTYPDLLAVPSKISDNVLKYAAQFRSRARIPALTYYHPITQCTITRSSQPLVGVRNNRSIQDERLVSACFYKSTDVFGGAGTLSGAGSSDDGGSGSVSSAGGASPEAETTVDVERFDEDLVLTPDVAYDDKTGSRLVGARRDNLIVDARPAINSYAMQMVGKGSENMDYYKGASKMFLSIENIHVMRDSLNKVIEAVKDADVSPLPPNRDLLAKSGWLKHIHGILVGSQIIAKQVGVRAAHVLIHCSDGWDRTSQLSALSQIMLDPYYRTIDGFIVLVEKDWLSFGHMFQQRSGHLNCEKWFTTQNDAMAGTKIEPGEGDARNEVFDNAVASAKRFFKKSLSQDKEDSDGDTLGSGGGGGGDDNFASAGAGGKPGEDSQATRPREISPVFHQFLDATYQLLRQHPTRFEYNERFLRRLLYHLYSCQYGTFLYNNERQRRDAHAKEKTSSVWDYFLSRRPEFMNPEYDPSIDGNDRQEDRLLFPRLKEIRWWHQVFNRTDEDMNAALNAAAVTAKMAANYHAASASLAPKLGPSGGAGDAGAASNSSSDSRPSVSPRRGASPMPPLAPSPASHSDPAADELDTTTVMAPTPENARSMLAMPTEGSSTGAAASLSRSMSSSSEAGAFAALREGISGLGLGQKMGGVLSSFGGSGSGSNGSRHQATSSHDASGGERGGGGRSLEMGGPERGEQEMREMS